MSVTYEIRPCVETEEGEVHEVPPNEADFWTVYRRRSDGLALALCDTLTREDAECVVGELEILNEAARFAWTTLEDIEASKRKGYLADALSRLRAIFRPKEAA